jgi:hypothetical protein
MPSIERAQANFDDAVAARTDAERALQNHHGRVAVAKAALDEAKRNVAAAIPVDRSATQLSGGGGVTEDHRETKDNGQQKGYVVLTEAERAKGFVRPVRDAYRHSKCSAITTMSRDLAETYARDPSFYSGTFCATCRGHFPVGADGEFTWYEMDGSEGPKVGT